MPSKGGSLLLEKRASGEKTRERGKGR